jgi:hypothetical protein
VLEANDWKPERLARVRDLIRQLFTVVHELTNEFSEHKRRFTLDGHLIGSIGEVVAAYAFNLELLPTGTRGHDAKTSDGRLVQIKITGGKEGVVLSSPPDHLIVLQLLQKGILLIYNGPGDIVWEKCGLPRRSGERWIGLTKLQGLDNDAQPKIIRVRDFPDLS